MRGVAVLTSFIALCTSGAVAFPQHGSLAGLSREALDIIIPTLQYRAPVSPPGPLNDTSTKLVNDAAHPFMPLRPGDIRGPCPGLNTLASHGYLPRNGIATPAQIIDAVQEGFNMANDLAVFVTYAAHLVDGNQVTNLLSIGSKSDLTGANPPSPAIVGGLDTHAVFEGDGSSTRGDAFFGDNHSFNESLFDEMVAFSNKFGAGSYNFTVGGEFKFQRIQDSIATNPNFTFLGLRPFTIYAEASFPVNFFIDGRQNDGQLNLTVARGFFQDMRMPDGFFRANGSQEATGAAQIAAAHPVQPGRNVGAVNNYVVDPTAPTLNEFCLLYTDFVNQTVRSLYPNPTGVLRSSLETNLGFLFNSDPAAAGCTQVFL